MKRLKKGSKILIANDSVGLTGVQVAVSNIASQLRKEGYEVVLMEPTDKEFLNVSVPIDKQFQWTLFATPIVTIKILEERPDAILITIPEAPIGKATKDVCELLEETNLCKQCPYTLNYTTNHGLGFAKNIENSFLGNFSKNKPKVKDIEKKIIFSIERKFLKNRFSGARSVIVNAQSSKEKLEEIGIKNIVVAPRGIDLEQFHLPKEENKNPYKDYDWYINDTKPVLLYLGRAAFEKDIQLFLEREYPDYHRVVAGDGPALGTLKKQYGGTEGVHFVGAVPRQLVPNYFMYASISIFPSSFDTFGITIVESAACGTPVIGFDVSGPRDVIKEGVMGVIVPKDRGILTGLDGALKISREECSNYTRENFTWEKSVKKIVENLYPIKYR